MEFRARNPDLSSRIVDVAYDELVAQPLEVVRRIGVTAGLDPGKAQPAQEEFAARNRQDRYRSQHGRHDYSAAEFGLEEGEIAERFALYRKAWPGAQG